MAEKTSDNLDRRASDLYKKALAALDRNNLDYAIEMFMECLKIEPAFIKGRQYLRAAQMKRVESVGSLKRMMMQAKLAPTVTKAKLAISKNPLEAINIAETALCDDPKNAQALMTLAEAAEAAKIPDIAAQALETHVKLNPRDHKASHWLARIYGVMGKHESAREVYERLIQANPNDFEAQKGLKDATAHGAMKGGGWQEAGSYRDVMKDKEEAVALEQQSRVVRAGDHVDNLIREVLEKAKLEPDSPLVQRELGKLYAQKEDYTAALQYLEKLFASEAGNDPTLEKEINEIKAKQLQIRINEKKTALAASPGNQQLVDEIAALDLEQSRIQLRDIERLVERYPNDLMYRFDLGVLYLKTGNLEGAVVQFQKSSDQPQRRVQSLGNLGQCFQQMGHVDLAIETYLKALEQLPTMDGVKKDTIYNLAGAYEQAGALDKATAEYKKIAAVDFGYKDVQKKIMRKPPA